MHVRTKEHILALLREQRATLRRFGVRRCGIFGSFVHNDSHDQSDVDILVEFEPGQKTFDHFMQLAFFLEDLFGRKVDLLTTESLSPYIGPHILREVEYVAVSA
ncbi:MAG TPA: nucleotidyltransferase family protein [Roseiflexaceae bacterium]|nr:nucleotidyltransferase family protein [Roseiflexaceae bacterium]HMP39268.1 nucleotidyltransferase family protein [Roseiflexaceae bacterium]